MYKLVTLLILCLGTSLLANSDTILFGSSNSAYVSAFSDSSNALNNTQNNVGTNNNGNNGIGNNGNGGGGGSIDDGGSCSAVPEPSTTVGIMGLSAGLYIYYRKKVICKSKN